jgi:hypothetical protein
MIGELDRPNGRYVTICDVIVNDARILGLARIP